MTRLLVLGMLDIQPMSGYDVQLMLKLNDSERWAGVLIGSIYHALKKMEAEGYVEVICIEQTGHRQKAVYQITEKGREYLKELTRDALKNASVVYPSSLYSGLSFVEKLPKEEAISALNVQAAALEQECRIFENGLLAKKAALHGIIPPMTELIFENIFAIIRQQQDFIERAKQLLNSSGTTE